ncbi:MAG TPA: hypothetical protein DDZ68_02375 [Parvularcula sp.]|nr:hypothetical protein [Parvularcula sp.]
MSKFWLAAAAIGSLLTAGEALAGEIVDMKFPVNTFENDGAPSSHVITKDNLGVPIDAITVAGVRPSYKLVQIGVGEKYFNVRVEKLVFANPGKYANLGRSVEWVCAGAGGRSRTGGAPGGSYSSRGLGVEPVCP